MPKIKKFNLKLSIYQIQQNLRRARFPFTDETIREAGLLCDELKNKITPAVYFQTFRNFSKKEDKSEISGITFPDAPSGAIAVSMVVSTLGPGAEEFANEHFVLKPINDGTPEGESDDISSPDDSKEDDGKAKESHLASAVISQASEEVKKFAWKIISDEVAEEKCVLSERMPLNDAASLENIKEILSRIEVFPTGNGLKPIYSFVEYAFWLPPARKKKV